MPTILFIKVLQPAVHFAENKCPAKCSIQEDCGVLRSCSDIAKVIVEKLGEKDGLWGLLDKPFVVGSSSRESLILNCVGRNKLQFSPLYVQQYCTKM